MIYGILFKRENIKQLFEVVKKNSKDYYLVGNSFYISTKLSDKKVSEAFGGLSISVTKIDDQKVSEDIMHWIVKVKTKEEAKKFEKENKNGLEAYLQFIQDFRDNLDKQLEEKERKGGEDIGS